MFGESSIQLGKLKLAAAALTANAIELQQQIRIIDACEKYRTRVSFIEHDLGGQQGLCQVAEHEFFRSQSRDVFLTTL